MRKEASLPVRLDAELRKRLDSTAERLGLTTSALIRLLAKSFVEEFENTGGAIIMPPQWQAQGAKLKKVAEGKNKYKTKGSS